MMKNDSEDLSSQSAKGNGMNIEEKESVSSEQKTQLIEKTSEGLIESASGGTEKERSRDNYLSASHKGLIKLSIKENFEKGNLYKRRALFEKIQTTFPELKETTFYHYYRQEEAKFYQALSRIPPEALINRISAENEYLKEKILEESEEDITKQVMVINKLNETDAKIHRLMDTPPLVQIKFETNLDTERLINPEISIENSEKI